MKKLSEKSGMGEEFQDRSAGRAETSTNAPTIRYYEEIGMLRPADRQSGGQRVYGDADVKRLTFIRRCREFGFSIDQVRVLVGLVQNPTELLHVCT